jgi:MFS family permease
MVATTLGAVAGPNAVEATGRVAQALNISVLAGPFLLAAGVTLLLAGLVAALAPGDSLGLLTLALALLGLGWNFGLISGTALIVDATPLETRARTQGTVDVLIASAGASGGALSGWIVATSSFAVLSVAGGLLALILIPSVLWSARTRTQAI